MLVATDAEKLGTVEASLKTINPNVQVLSVATNIADANSVAELFAKVKANFGHADILVKQLTPAVETSTSKTRTSGGSYSPPQSVSS